MIGTIVREAVRDGRVILETKPVECFRKLYPKGENHIISPAVRKPYRIRRGDLSFTVCTTGDLSA